MNRIYSEDELAFAESIRSWVQKNLDPKVRDKMLVGGQLTWEEKVSWWKTLHSQGWSAPGFPPEFGGTGWNIVEQTIYFTVLAEEGAPINNVWAQNMMGPVLLEFGSDAQKELIPRMLSVDDFWCQGFSEPGAGSDLAGLKTKAEDKGDHWLVNGQKLWTTNAHHANKIFLLVRTDTTVIPQSGISMLLADMDTPGIQVRPVITIDRKHEVNEVFFTDVVVPKRNIVGKPGQGWDIAKFLLSNERVGIAQVGLQKLLLRRLKNLIETRPRGDQYANEVRRLEVDILGCEVSGLRLLKAEKITAQPSLLKLKSSEIIQRCFELAVEIAGLDGLPYDEASQLHAEHSWLDASVASLFSEYCESRAYTIFGGTSEVQHNIIAKAALGL